MEYVYCKCECGCTNQIPSYNITGLCLFCYRNHRNFKKIPLVSVIIPTLSSRKNELKRAILSVVNQTYPDIEIIIERGGKNVQDARNIAVDKSNGKYIAFLDDDDEFYPTKIEKQVKYMESHINCPLCITWGDDNRFGTFHQYQPKEWWNFNDLIRGFNITCTSGFMVRRGLYDLIGGMDDTLVDSHEYDLALRLSRYSRIYCIQESLVRFNNASDGNWSSDYGRKIKGMFQFTRKYGCHYNIIRWLKTTLCFTLFFIATIDPRPIEKLFTLTKMKMERVDVLKNPTLFERFKA